MAQDSLTTPRLHLRPLTEADFDAVHAYASDPEAVRHMTWGPNTPADTRMYLRSQNLPPGMHAYGICLRDDGRLIGSCSLWEEDLDGRQGAFGYILNRAFWGLGYATEAAAALLRLGFGPLGMHRISATCRPENLASQRVLEKLGMRREAHFQQQVYVRGRWRDTYLYALLASEWRDPRRRAVIFDMDGVLLDSEPVYFASNQQIFQRLGFTVSHNDYAQFVGLDAQRMWRHLKDLHHLPQTIDELVRMEVDGMLAGLEQADLAPMPGLPSLLAELQRRGIPLALASSSSHAVIRLILRKLGLHEAFPVSVSGEDVPHGKPAPDIFLHTAARLGSAPPRCLVIEDSANGVRAARAAGMRSLGFAHPQAGPQDLSPADSLIHAFDPDGIGRVLDMVDEI